MTQVPTVFATLLLTASLLLTTTTSNSRTLGPGRPRPARPTTEARRARQIAAFEQHVLRSYLKTKLIEYGMPANVYREALMGYYSLNRYGLVAPDRQVLTVIDFEQPSRQKRLWVIDLKEQAVLFYTLVAHGKNTGDDLAQAFSNEEGSEKSSLGFYVTGTTYQGKHGLSLRLHGLDPGYNTNAASRAVVVHGADYVSEEFVRQHSRLGRSQGCPALPLEQSAAIIQTIADGSVVYAHGPNTVPYQSEWLQLEPVLLTFAQQRGRPGS